jgi:hypothetical protein
MEHIDSEKAAKAREFIYSGKVFKEGVREDGVEEPVVEEKKPVEEGSSEERGKKMEEIRKELFNGKLFK